MATFDLCGTNTKTKHETESAVGSPILDSNCVKDECVISMKVYDSCRQQNCFTGDDLGPARAAEDAEIGDTHYSEGEVITPPPEAATVKVDKLHVEKITVMEKSPSPFKYGYWDFDVQYVFVYRLVFREVNGNTLGSIMARSIVHKQCCLFGSIVQDTIIATDLFKQLTGDSVTLDADPFIMVEAKAIALSADMCGCGESVSVTIGLFTIIKLFRIVPLIVESKGFCIPAECPDISPAKPCDYFNSVDFPMDIFAPPQKPEFFAGVSGNIAKEPSSAPCDKCGKNFI